LNSQYFVTAKLAVPQGDVAEDYIVRAYIETFDGTKVYGPSRTLCVNDGLNSTTVNLVVEASEPLSGKGYTATFGLDGTGTSATAVELLASDETGYSTFRLTLPEGTSLPSASKFIVKDGDGNTVATEIYRNYYTTHDPGDGTNTIKADTTWYDIDTKADLFIIASSADVYGLNALIKKDIYFEGKTVLLIKDVVLNKGTAVPSDGTSVPSWKPDDGEATFQWVPAGGNYANYNFNGTFDGDGNTVSGLYINESSLSVGFFGGLSPKAIVQNFGIINSYIANTGKQTGSIVGAFYGTRLENVYSDAIIVSGGQAKGGITGFIQSVDNTVEHVLSKCWFNGQVYSTAAGGYGIGAMTGQMYDETSSKFTFTDCLFSGEIINKGDNWPNIGGVIGYCTTGSPKVTIDNCIITGEIIPNTTNLGGVGGCLGYTPKLTSGGYMNNSYTTTDSGCSKIVGSDAGSIVIKCDKAAVDKSTLLLKTQEELLAKLPLLSGQEESPWMCYVDEEGNALGTPLLKTFASLWIEKQAAN
jgi:hypothetical protein